MQTTVVVFPFDLFGSGGAAAGASLLADELREILADNKRERVPTRADVYASKVRLREHTFETLDAYKDWREQGRQAVKQVLKPGHFFLWLSGNHLGVLPVYDELAGSGDDTLVVQLDAHLDIHHFVDCSSELSHGNFLRHCDGPLPPIVNVGHRDLLLPDDEVRVHYRSAFSAAELAVDPRLSLEHVRSAASLARRVILDIDCDVLDAAFFPAVAEPVPFGLSPQQLLQVIDAAWTDGVAGVCVSEFDPGRDRNDQSLTTLVWLLEHLLLRRYTGPAAAPRSRKKER